MRGSIRVVALIGALIAGAFAAAPVSAGGSNCDGGQSGALDVLGLTRSGQLVCFEVSSPGQREDLGTISGLVGDSELVGIDFRPANGLLYGLGDLGGIYTVDTSSATATKVSQLTIPLTGDMFGVDFNPAADALRVVGDDGQNLRHPFSTGVTTMDVTLNYVGPPPVSPALGVTGAGYTNNDADATTGTVLYDIDTNLDQLVIQAPPNSGTLNLVGKLGIDVAGRVGFDIYSEISDGSTQRVRAFAALKTSAGRGFYSINLASGKAVKLGSLRPILVDFAIPLDQN